MEKMKERPTIQPRPDRLKSRIERFLGNDVNLSEIMAALENHDAFSIEALKTIKQHNPEAYETVIEANKIDRAFEKFLDDPENNLRQEAFGAEPNPKSRQQLMLIHAVREFIRDRNVGEQIKGYIRMPTGTGKSREISKLTEIFNEAGSNVLILTPTKFLNKQTAYEMLNGNHIPGDKKFSDDEIAIVDSDHPGDFNPLARVQIVTYDSLKRFQDGADRAGYKVGVVLRDELHRSGTDLKDYLINTVGEDREVVLKMNDNEVDNLLVKYKVPQIGLTATDFVANKNAEDFGFECIHRQHIDEAIKEGYLAQDIYANNQQLDLEISSEFVNAWGEKDFKIAETDRNREKLTESNNNNYRLVLEELKVKENDFENYPLAIDFCNYVKDAIYDARMGNQEFGKDLGVSIDVEDIKTENDLNALVTSVDDVGRKVVIFNMPIYGDMPTGLKDRIMELYKEGRIRRLSCGPKILNEGKDIPQAQVACLPPTGSLTTYIQRVGRVLRKFGETKKFIFDNYLKDKNKRTYHFVDLWRRIPKELNRDDKTFADSYKEKLAESGGNLNKNEQEFLELSKELEIKSDNAVDLGQGALDYMEVAKDIPTESGRMDWEGFADSWETEAGRNVLKQYILDALPDWEERKDWKKIPYDSKKGSRDRSKAGTGSYLMSPLQHVFKTMITPGKMAGLGQIRNKLLSCVRFRIDGVDREIVLREVYNRYKAKHGLNEVFTGKGHTKKEALQERQNMDMFFEFLARESDGNE